MKKLTFFFAAVAVFIFACSDKESYYDDKGTFIDPKAITFVDTSSSSFTNFEIKDKSRKKKIAQLTADFYKDNQYKSRWLYKKKRTKLLDNYFKELKRARDYGLNPETYNYNELYTRVYKYYESGNKDQTDLEQLDKEITASFLLFVIHLNNGRIVPHNNGKKIWKKEKKVDSDAHLQLLLSIDDKKDIVKVLDTIHPRHKFYTDLRNQLRKLNAEEEKDIKQFKFEDAKVFKVGYEHENVGFVRHNLNEWKIPVKQDSNINVVDSALIKSLMLFQKSRSIAQDGLPGENTLRYLNMTKEELSKLISLNLERMRWLPNNFGENYILVNVPEFILRVYNEDDIKVKMRVIVGKQYNPTPIFSDTLKYIVFRPTWTVPQSIIQKEMIPMLAKDASHYSKKNFKVYEGDKEIDPKSINWKSSSTKERYFTFVQQPSAANALGLVKFIMPNDMSIYLHDTPTDYLFEKEERAMSHGCIRLEYPAELATYLLKDVEGWDEAKVKSSIAEGDTKRVDLNTNYHVQIAYLTTWIDEGGELIIAEDIYGHDKKQLQELSNL